MPKTIGYIQGIPVIVPDDWETRTLGPDFINIPPERGLKIIYEDKANFGALEGSPFGPYFHNPLILPKDSNIPKEKQLPRNNYWKVDVLTYTSGINLLKDYYDNSKFAFNKKSDDTDEEVDMLVLYEKDDAFNFTGTTCLVRINYALAKFISKRVAFANPNWLAKGIIESHERYSKQKGFAKMDENLLTEAIEYELRFRGLDVLTEMIKEGLTKNFKEFTYDFRKLKLGEERWQSSYLEYNPLIKLTDDIENAFKNWEDLKQSQLELINNAYILVNIADWLSAEKTAQILDNCFAIWEATISAIDNILAQVKKLQSIIELINAFVCGVINEVIEIIAAIMDMMLLTVSLANKLDRIEVSETLEDTLEKYVTNPQYIIQRIQTLWDELVTKYSNAENADEVAYLLGEDVVEVIMWVDAIEGLVVLARIMGKGFKGLVDWLKKLKGKVDDVVPSFVVKDAEELSMFALANGLRKDIDLAFVIKMTKGDSRLIENILLSTKEVIEGKTVVELYKYFKIADPPIVYSLSNYQARIWYTYKKLQIDKVIKNVSSLEAKARKAFELRNKYRSETRNYMKDRELREFLELNEKNQEWDKLLKRTLEKEDINTLEEAYYDIIQKSMSGRDDVDKLFKIKK